MLKLKRKRHLDEIVAAVLFFVIGLLLTIGSVAITKEDGLAPGAAVFIGAIVNFFLSYSIWFDKVRCVVIGLNNVDRRK